MRATIIGAGIGGLTLSIALKRNGIDSEVFEAFSSFKPIGAGIMLAGNAMEVYEKLGLSKQISAKGQAIERMCITNENLKVLSSVQANRFAKSTLPTTAIHRGHLQQILLDQINPSTIRPGKRLISMGDVKGVIELKFEDQGYHAASIVIGADGIHSKVRQQVIPETRIRSAQQICWRGIANFSLPVPYQNQLTELWGRGRRFGFVKINSEKVYWYALKRDDMAERQPSGTLADEFTFFHPLVKEIISSTNTNEIIRNEIQDLKPVNRWYRNQICLIGDAAHAATPNLGQGACQAIEDAYVLSSTLKNEQSMEKAFYMYQQKRKAAALRVVSMSWRIGKIAHWKNPMLVKMRNTVMQLVP